MNIRADAADEHGVITGYMCLIDYEHELGNASDGNKVYPSIEALKRDHPMWKECGIVEVQVRGSRVVVNQALVKPPL